MPEVEMGLYKRCLQEVDNATGAAVAHVDRVFTREPREIGMGLQDLASYRQNDALGRCRPSPLVGTPARLLPAESHS